MIVLMQGQKPACHFAHAVALGRIHPKAASILRSGSALNHSNILHHSFFANIYCNTVA